MSADAIEIPPRSPSPAAKRMRAYRTRLRNRMRYVRIALRITHIEALIRKGFLKPQDRDDPEALQWAVDDAINAVLDDAATTGVY